VRDVLFIFPSLITIIIIIIIIIQEVNTQSKVAARKEEGLEEIVNYAFQIVRLHSSTQNHGQLTDLRY
jgi:hypothetical protein